MNPDSADPIALSAVLPNRVGRPPRVNLQLIVDAALAIGLDRVSLPMVADRLGVGSSTLYRHVRNRDELLRLATVKVALERRLPTGVGLHWSELAGRYAESLFESLAREPLVIQELMRGRLGPDIEVDYLEPFLEAMSQHGFAPGEGLQLFRAIGMLAVGAAVAATAQQSRASGGEEGEAFARALAERPAGALPRIRAALAANVDLNAGDWKTLLRHLLSGVAAARGEILPCAGAVP
ncbi:MAG: TetR/AcrR family transcriptional regulator [Hydrocarboniphaga sp.]|uniref:TetR/AcrR family transcriptional regulator n=1 Tax=Hydrocarboniphaga sp. TaxID=2033016 RepID=UPI00262CCA85|nr:helix-turn-helix domain-containing protein [Hydrocarboniphaga sp.]MDB5972727.1 TetR/AcrR family transcriptional regulator [Hydrocarboniphaga sp.]